MKASLHEKKKNDVEEVKKKFNLFIHDSEFKIKDIKEKIEEVNAILREAALNGDLVEQIHYSNSTEYVSSQAVGMITTSVLDAPSTIVSNDGKTATIYAWYDNEFGYSCQVVRLAKHAAKVRRFHYY